MLTRQFFSRTGRAGNPSTSPVMSSIDPGSCQHLCCAEQCLYHINHTSEFVNERTTCKYSNGRYPLCELNLGYH